MRLSVCLDREQIVVGGTDGVIESETLFLTAPADNAAVELLFVLCLAQDITDHHELLIVRSEAALSADHFGNFSGREADRGIVLVLPRCSVLALPGGAVRILPRRSVLTLERGSIRFRLRRAFLHV